MRIASYAAGFVAIAAFTAAPAFAQRGHQPSAPTPHTATPTTTTHGNSHATSPTPHTSTGTQPPATHGNGHATTRGRTTTTSTSTGTTNTTTPTTNSTTSTTNTTTPTTNPIATRISRNPRLADRLTHMLPAGMTLATASEGFRNQGQFIAALHVAQNQHIPFADLKAAMTGPNAVSLGQAIHTLRPSANADDAVRRANTQTQADVR